MDASGSGEDDRLLHRLLFFSDAVFAIVLTLLVLELRPPVTHDGASVSAVLAGMVPHFVAFGLSFAVVAVYWAAHMSTLRRLAHFDWPTAWANVAFLAPVCLTPFASSLLGEGRFGAGAWMFYAYVLIATSMANLLLWLTASRGAGRLMGGLSGREQAYRGLRAATPGLTFAGSLLALHFNQLQLAQFCWILIPLILIFLERAVKPRAARPAPTPP
ncbi:TMEM175 family protein [Phenylobacterium aquaticum]|nr:TMEM175 family protein [Phenylobacterium aquaticum]